jgi:predicted nucleic acid-binding protein
MKYLYDTNIFIYYLTDEIQVDYLFTQDFLTNNTVFISPIIRIELLSFNTISSAEEIIIKNLLSQFNSIDWSSTIENKTIQLKRQYKTKLPDAIIAATAISENAILVTRNVKDFQGINNLTIENPFNN